MNKNLNTANETMKKLVAHIINILDDYVNISQYKNEVNALKNPTDQLKSDAKSLQSDLTKIFKEENDFLALLDTLKNEKDYFEELNKLINEIDQFNTIDMDQLDQDADSFNTILKDVRYDLDLIEKEFEQLMKESKSLEEKKLNQQTLDELDKLLEDAFIQQEAIKQIEKEETVNELEDDISKMIIRCEKYRNNILNYLHKCN